MSQFATTAPRPHDTAMFHAETAPSLRRKTARHFQGYASENVAGRCVPGRKDFTRGRCSPSQQTAPSCATSSCQQLSFHFPQSCRSFGLSGMTETKFLQQSSRDLPFPHSSSLCAPRLVWTNREHCFCQPNLPRWLSNVDRIFLCCPAAQRGVQRAYRTSAAVQSRRSSAWPGSSIWTISNHFALSPLGLSPSGHRRRRKTRPGVEKLGRLILRGTRRHPLGKSQHDRFPLQPSTKGQ